MAKVNRKNKIRMGNKVMTFETPLFGNSGHIEYSGYGCHEDKSRKSERRRNKEEARRITRGDW